MHSECVSDVALWLLYLSLLTGEAEDGGVFEGGREEIFECFFKFRVLFGGPESGELMALLRL